MNSETQGQFENLAREAVGCRECFMRREVAAPYIDVAQPRWVGRKYWENSFRVTILMLNPGQSRRDSGATEFLRLIHGFRDHSVELRSILDGQRESMRSWGNPRGRFTAFYIDGLGLNFDDIAFANVAWCATANNSYPGTMLNRCFELHTGPLLRILNPDIVLASGSKAHMFGKRIRSMLPKAKIINAMHYAHRAGRAAEEAELMRVRAALKLARAQFRGHL